ncbi:MAG: 4-hydroxy-tetrahydrodipicolinate synthase [Ignavibacteria bacterium]|jgi:4-hydroxy-tetrahydrodipicolinate synthase
MKELKGVGTALVTPFKKNLEVDYTTFRNSVKRQIKNGIHFLLPLGTTGETPCLDNNEKIKIIEIALEEASGKIPVFIGAGSNSTKHTIDTIKEYDKTGVDGYLIVTPYYNKPTQAGLFNHFKAVSESTKKSIILYNVPGRTSINMLAETTLKVAELKNVIAVKEASGIYSQISEIIKYAPKGFSVVSGNDDEILSLCVTGARGVISVASNIAPKEMSSYLNIILKGDFKTAKTVHHKLMPLFKNCFIESNPIPVKAGMNYLGLMENILRPPLYKSNDNTYRIIKQTIKDLGIKY